MSRTPSCLPERRGAEVRRIPLLCLDGRAQMAIDQWLLDQAVAGGGPAFRLYRWSRPTLSLGFHQKRLDPRWSSLVRKGEIEVVRRPTGGQAVLHAGDITYALIWPDATPGRKAAYAQACGWIIEAFRTIGLPLRFGTDPARRGSGNCFASSTTADLVHADDAKRVGSAQLWRRGCLLQHGSIQVAPPTGLWRKVFQQEPPPLPSLRMEMEQLLELLSRSAERHLPFLQGKDPMLPTPWREQPLTDAEWALIAGRRDSYSLDLARAWDVSQPTGWMTDGGDSGGIDTSPERTMAWAT